MDAFSVIKAFAALLFVLGLIALGAFVLRRLPGGLMRAASPRDKEEAVLRVIETRRLGVSHQLVRLAYGQEEHLLLLGPKGDMVVARRALRAAGDQEGGAS